MRVSYHCSFGLLMIMLSDLALHAHLHSIPETKANVIFCTLIIYSVPQLNENIHHQILNWTALQCYYQCLLPFELELTTIFCACWS
ncbi:hypothetical protein GLYMA_16G004100v4 [Glycine max]|uniref:Secreted protein n=1 Tax=Glycine max TaxID=3847 RepID=A0A0R0FTP7_SOYBN|nr:hypothetical protein GYH30_043712 [Glycine max]KRH06091.1 hypothetical protein GLYMA_16G004100v4 [Glycine max]